MIGCADDARPTDAGAGGGPDAAPDADPFVTTTRGWACMETGTPWCRYATRCMLDGGPPLIDATPESGGHCWEEYVARCCDASETCGELLELGPGALDACADAYRDAPCGEPPAACSAIGL